MLTNRTGWAFVFIALAGCAGDVDPEPVTVASCTDELNDCVLGGARQDVCQVAFEACVEVADAH